MAMSAYDPLRIFIGEDCDAYSLDLGKRRGLVLFDLLALGRLADKLEAPERNALWAIEAALQKQLVAPFSACYAEQLKHARSSLVLRYGD